MKSKSGLTILHLRSELISPSVVAGGAVAHTLGIINGFQRHGNKVISASTHMLDELRDVVGGDQVIPLSLPRVVRLLPWRLSIVVSNISFAIRIVRQLRRQKIDLVYQRHALNSVLGAILSWWYKVPLMLEYNSSRIWTEKNWEPQSPFRFLFLTKWLERFALRNATYIASVSEASKEDLIASGISADKIVIVPNGVDVDEYNPEILSASREKLRGKLGLKNNFVFGFIGTFGPWHGVKVLGEIVAPVTEACPNARFLYIGDGVLRPALEKKICEDGLEKFVVFTGAIPQKEAKHYLAACDVFLCPTQKNKDGSKFFGSPTKIFEYLSMGRPILASDLEQVGDILSPSERISGSELPSLNNNDSVAVLTDADDIEGFVNGAVALVESNEEFRSAMGRSARKTAVCNHAWRHRVSSILDFVDVKRELL